MRAYRNIKFIELADVADIQQHGRKSSVGRCIDNGRDYRGYIKNTEYKKRLRRALKKRDNNIEKRIERKLERIG